jgi:hypothetical protein
LKKVFNVSLERTNKDKPHTKIQYADNECLQDLARAKSFPFLDDFSRLPAKRGNRRAGGLI